MKFLNKIFHLVQQIFDLILVRILVIHILKRMLGRIQPPPRQRKQLLGRVVTTQNNYMRGVINNVLIGGMYWPQTNATNFHAQLELSDKGRTITGLVFC